jgi:hypothetical protein
MTDKETAFSLSVVLPAVDYSTYSSKPDQIPPGLVSARTEVGLAVIGKWWLRALPSPYSLQPLEDLDRLIPCNRPPFEATLSAITSQRRPSFRPPLGHRSLYCQFMVTDPED